MEMKWTNFLHCFLSILLVVVISPLFSGQEVDSRRIYDVNDDDQEKTIQLDEWKNAGIGQICTPEDTLLEKLEKHPNDTTFRKEMATKYCGATPKLACTFEVPDLTENTLVCDCKDRAETWDEDAKECRRFAGRKQSCTDDSQCVTGATCKNEAAKLRDYSRWEAELFKMYHLTTPRAFGNKDPGYGKVKSLDINDARRRRKRILSRIVRSFQKKKIIFGQNHNLTTPQLLTVSEDFDTIIKNSDFVKRRRIRRQILSRLSRASYKEEFGECTCDRSELKLEHLNKIDPCISRKRPPPLHLSDDGNSLIPSSILLYLLLLLLQLFYYSV